MRDVEVVGLAAKQFNRFSRQQLLEGGFSDAAIEHRLATGRFTATEQGVFAISPVLEHDDWGRWMGATLTAPGSVLSHLSAAAAWGFLIWRRRFEIVTRPGSGGPRRLGGVIVHRSSTLEGATTTLNGIPITTVARTIVDLAASLTSKALARAVREAVRLGLVTLWELADARGRYRFRRGSRQLARTIARYSGLPIERARSGAEVRAIEVLHAAGRPMPRLNVRVAGEEADLSWPESRLIIEIDGGPFHLDIGEDARKQAAWEEAGWRVERLPSDEVHERPQVLLALAPPANVRG